MHPWLAEQEGFEGSGDDLTRLLERAIKTLELEDGVRPNLRLIRDYAQKGILSRPGRQGKEAVYDFRHVVEYLSARRLVADGWPLSKIAEYVRSSTLDNLADLLPRPGAKPALDVVRGLLAETRSASEARSASKAGRASSRPREASSSREVHDRLARSTVAQASLPDLLSALGAGARPDVEEYTTIHLAPGLVVALSRARLDNLTTEQAEQIGRAVTASLLWTLNKKGTS